MLNICFLLDFEQKWYMSTDFNEIPQKNFHNNPSGVRFFQAARPTDRRTDMTKLRVIFDFLNYFAKAPKIFGVTYFQFYACSQRNCEMQLSIPWNFMLGDFIKVVLFQCHHMSLMDFVVSPTGCRWSVTDVWSWDAHEAQLRCPGEVDGLNP
jgi:hypothetical protein